MFVFSCQHFLIRRMKQAMGLAGREPGGFFPEPWSSDRPGGVCGIRPPRHRRVPGTDVWRKGCRRAAGSQGAGMGAPLCSLLPLRPQTWPGLADRCPHAPEEPFPGFQQLWLQPFSPSPTLPGSQLPADTGGQASARATAAHGPTQLVRPASWLRHRGGRPSPSSCHHTRGTSPRGDESS